MGGGVEAVFGVVTGFAVGVEFVAQGFGGGTGGITGGAGLVEGGAFGGELLFKAPDFEAVLLLLAVVFAVLLAQTGKAGFVVARVLREVLLALAVFFEGAAQLGELGGALQGLVFGVFVRFFGGGVLFGEGGELGFVDAAVGKEVFKCGAVFLILGLSGVQLALGLVVLPALQTVREVLLFLVEFAPLPGSGGFLGEFVALFAELLQAVVVAGEVFAHVGHARFAFFTPRFVVGDARRFFDVAAQFFGFGFDDAADHALFDDGVAARAHAGALQEFDDVAPPHAFVVDAVLGLAVAADFACDDELGVVSKRTARAAIAVVEMQGNARHARCPPIRRAGKDDVSHRLAAQLFGGGFTQYPAHGVTDVGFAAAVRTDNAGNGGVYRKGGVISKGFESGEADGGEAHGGLLSVVKGRVLYASRSDGFVSRLQQDVTFLILARQWFFPIMCRRCFFGFFIMLNRFFLLCLLAVLSGCSSSGKKGDDVVVRPVMRGDTAVVDNARQTVQWPGTYQGILPCSTCEGVATMIVLKPDMTYQTRTRMLGIDDKDRTSKGRFEWLPDGSHIAIDSEGQRKIFRVHPDHLEMRLPNGEQIPTANPEAFQLMKDAMM